MQFKVENLSEVWDEIFPLIKNNFDETGVKGPPFNPTRSFYERLQSKNIFHVVVARNKQNEAIGFSFMLVSTHPQFEDTLFANQEAFYVLPEYRGITGFKFFQHVEQNLLSLGVKFIVRDSCKENDWSKTLIKSGYREIKKLFIKKTEAI